MKTKTNSKVIKLVFFMNTIKLRNDSNRKRRTKFFSRHMRMKRFQKTNLEKHLQ